MQAILRFLATRLRRIRLSYANVISTLALFLALGGVSYAAVALPTNSVGTPQLQSKAVTASKIARDAVTGSNVRDRTLRAQDFAKGQLPTGATGPPGVKGDSGTNGSNGATNLVIRTAYLGGGTGQVSCATGEKATGGGLTGDSTLDIINASEPSPNKGTPTGWRGSIRRAGGAFSSGTIYVICASPCRTNHTSGRHRRRVSGMRQCSGHPNRPQAAIQLGSVYGNERVVGVAG